MLWGGAAEALGLREPWDTDLSIAMLEHGVTDPKQLPRNVRVGILGRHIHVGLDGLSIEPDVSQFMYSCATFGPDAVAQFAEDGTVVIRQLSVKPGQQYRSVEETVTTLRQIAQEGGWRNE